LRGAARRPRRAKPMRGGRRRALEDVSAPHYLPISSGDDFWHGRGLLLPTRRRRVLHLHLRLACRRTSDARMGGSSAPRRHDSRGLRSEARSSPDGVEGRLMTDVASLGVWPLGTFAWCVRSARTAPFRTRSLRAALLTSRLPPPCSIQGGVRAPSARVRWRRCEPR
jgi:hypothetical protein